MKKLLKALIGIAVLFGIVALLWSLLAPLIRNEIFNMIGNAFETTTDSEEIPEGTYKIPVHVYFQNVDDGSYEKRSETVRYLTSGSELTYTPEEYDYYDIDTEKSVLSATDEGDVIEVYYTCETCKIFFDTGAATVVDGYAIQTIRKGQLPIAPTLSLKGYTCVGYDKPIEPVFEDTVYTASFEKTNYRLFLYATNDTTLPDSFVRNENADGCFETTYTFEDTVTIPQPQSKGYTFIEWNTSPDGNGETVNEINVGTYADTALYAIYTVRFYSIGFATVDGINYPSYYLQYGTPVSAPIIAPEHQKAGYGLYWYTDSTWTTLYDFRTMPADNVTLYGRWEEDTGTGFLSWEHDKISENTIDSLEELTDLLDYVFFHNILEPICVEVTYADKSALELDIKEAHQKLREFRSGDSLSYGISSSGMTKPGAKCLLSLNVNTHYRNTEATKTTASTGQKALTYLAPSVTPRGENYTDFYIDKLTLSYPVSTSNQLLYVVEHGYRPLPEKDSPAETVYLAARKLLNEILPQNATALEKAELIYNYLITSIEYDDNAVSITQNNPDAHWPEYDAFYLEGVFLHQKAVCDGISSAFSLLCNIEGIPTVKVIGDDHAWNRVKINNRWYVADPTFGNMHIVGKDYSLADHSHFLISDADKTTLGNTGWNYRSITADKTYGYFENKTVTYNNRTFDYKIDSETELANFLEYINSLSDNPQNATVNFTCSIKDFSAAFNTALRILKIRGITLKIEPQIYLRNQIYQLVYLEETSKNPYSIRNRDFFRCYVRCKVLCSDNLEFNCRTRFIANVYLRKRRNACN